MKLNFGVRLPVSGPLASKRIILAMGEAADELGFDAVTTHDHVSFSYQERYHNAGGVAELVDEADKQGIPVTSNFETMTTLALVAGKSQNVRLVPCSAVLPIRHPVLFAKQSVTLFELSGGRFVLNVCIGNIKSDFDAMGVPLKLRGRMTDEYMQVIRLMLSEQKQVSYQGKYIKFPPSEFYPKPLSKMPFWFSGHFNDIVLERVAKYCDGLLAGSSFPDEFGKWVPKLEQRLKEHGRTLPEVEVGVQTFLCISKDPEAAKRTSRRTIESYFHGPEFDKPDTNDPTKTRREVRMDAVVKAALVGSPDQVIKKVEAYAENGVKFFDIRMVNSSLSAILEMMQLFAREVFPSFE